MCVIKDIGAYDSIILFLLICFMVCLRYKILNKTENYMMLAYDMQLEHHPPGFSYSCINEQFLFLFEQNDIVLQDRLYLI